MYKIIGYELSYSKLKDNDNEQSWRRHTEIFDSFPKARARAIQILKSHLTNPDSKYWFREEVWTDDTGDTSVMRHRIYMYSSTQGVRNHRRYVTIKYHAYKGAPIDPLVTPNWENWQ